MIYLFLFIAVAAGLALVPSVGRALSKAVGRPAGKIQRWAQTGLLGSLMMFSLYIKLLPFALLLLLVWAGIIGTNFVRDKMIGEELQDRHSSNARPPPPAMGTMSRKEALSVLGLQEGIGEGGIDAAYKKLISQIHPDKGGTDYLAAKINEARDVLKKG